MEIKKGFLEIPETLGCSPLRYLFDTSRKGYFGWINRTAHD